jgi:hypothetical protein
MYTIKDNILTFDEEFNQSIDNIIFPDDIVSIIFNWKFNQPIDNVKFPDTVQIITFGGGFNQPIDRIKFPESLISIDFGYYFNQSLDKVKFPGSLKKIKFGTMYSQPIDKVIFPESLETIILGPSPFDSIKNANIIKFIKNISYNSGTFGNCQHNINYELIDISNDNIESVTLQGGKIPSMIVLYH